MEVSLKFLSIVFEFKVLQTPHVAWYQWSTGEKTVVSTRDSSWVFAGVAVLGIQIGTHRTAPSHWPMIIPPVRGHSFSLRKLGWPLLANTHTPVPASLFRVLWTNLRHSEYLVTTREKWCYYLDSWSRQSLQNHFINHILEPVRKYILQTTITIVSFEKWILNFHLVHQNLPPKWNACFCFLIQMVMMAWSVMGGQHPNEDKQRIQERRWKSYNKL